eukprot:322322_1
MSHCYACDGEQKRQYSPPTFGLNIGNFHVHCRYMPPSTQKKNEIITGAFPLISKKEMMPRHLVNVLREFGDWNRIQKMSTMTEWKQYILPFDMAYCQGALETYDSKCIMCGPHCADAYVKQFMVHLETYGLSATNLDDVLPTIFEMMSLNERANMGWWITSFIGMVMILLAEYLYNLFKTKSIKQIIYLCNKIQ